MFSSSADAALGPLPQRIHNLTWVKNISRAEANLKFWKEAQKRTFGESLTQHLLARDAAADEEGEEASKTGDWRPALYELYFLSITAWLMRVEMIFGTPHSTSLIRTDTLRHFIYTERIYKRQAEYIPDGKWIGFLRLLWCTSNAFSTHSRLHLWVLSLSSWESPLVVIAITKWWTGVPPWVLVPGLFHSLFLFQRKVMRN